MTPWRECIDLIIPCPHCEGKVRYWFLAASIECPKDSFGIYCKNCHHDFSQEEWDKVVGKHVECEQPVVG